MSTVMEPKKFAFFMKDESRSFIGRDSYQFSRSNSPVRFGARRATSSTNRPLSPNDISCVALETSKDDCATQRFIVWAAVRRNACLRMDEEKRLECPLLRCQQRFPDHEAMLRHLITCDLLSECEYWCYEHQRVERFDDSRCKRCIGHPSKRRKMLTMAKSFFTSLGHSKGKASLGPSSSLSSSSLAASSLNEPWLSDDVMLDMYNGSDACPSRSVSIGSSNSSNSSSTGGGRYNSTRSAASHRSGVSEATCGTGRSNSYRRGADVIDVVDVSARNSMSASPCNMGSFLPPPRYEDMGSGVPSELQSTEVIAELEAPFMPQQPHQPQQQQQQQQQPVTSTTAVYASAQIQTPQLQHPIEPDITDINDFFGDIAATAPTFQNQNAALVAPTLALTPPRSYSTLPSNVLSTVSPVDGLSSVDPASLRVSEPENVPASLINWEPPLAAVPASLGSFDASGAVPQPFFDFDSLLPGVGPDQPLAGDGTQSLQYRSSVRSTASTNTTASALSMASMISDASGTSMMSSATSIVPPVSDTANAWPAADVQTQTKLVPPADDFAGLFSGELPLSGLSSCDTLDTTYPTTMPEMPTVPGLPDVTADLSMLYGFGSMPMPTVPVPPKLDDTAAPMAPVPSTVSEAANDSDDSFQDLTTAAQDVLATHVTTSFAKLANVNSADNTLAHAFKNATMRKIMDTGVDSLQKALASGTEVMPAFETLCFLHLVYSFLLGVYKTKASLKSYALFYQSLEYARNFQSGQDRDNYLEIVSLIWQPAGMSASDLAKTLRSCRNGSARPPQFSFLPYQLNEVAGTIKAFLDNLEMAAILDPTASSPATPMATADTIQASNLFAMHFGRYYGMTCPVLSVQEKEVVDTLLRGFPGFPDLSSTPGLRLQLEALRHQLSNGRSPSNIRWLEVSLLQAGRASLGSSSAYFDKFVPVITMLCDTLYAANASNVPVRAAYYDAACSLLRINLVCCNAVHQGVEPRMPANVYPNDVLAGIDFGIFKNKLDVPLAKLLTAEELARLSASSSSSSSSRSSTSTSPSPSSSASPATASSKDALSTPLTVPDGAASSSPLKKTEVEATDVCELCGYRPKGDPKWFRGSMLKHRQTKHADEVVIYKCNFPGCTSQYRNRPDNLKQHQVEKNHFVGDEATVKKPRKPKTKRTASGEVDLSSAAKKRKTTDQGDSLP